MARFNWDRLRRNLPLDGADARVDPDGAVLWEREVGEAREVDGHPPRDRFDTNPGVRRLRAGIIVRRAREREQQAGDAPPRDVPAPRPPQPRTPVAFDPNAWVECPRCKARVPRRKLLLHARAACERR